MLSIKDIIEATNGEIISEGVSYFTGISIDSRTIKEGELFIGLKGERFDGNDFAEEALKVGGGALISSKFKVQSSKFENKSLILVDDTLLALHRLAGYIRRRFKGTVTGVVGSNGKTTTKELIASILSTRLKVHKSAGNLNNQIGLPLCIVNGFRDWGLEINKEDIMVLEMGTNRPWDIKELCEIAMPDLGVVTNIGYEHLEGFSTLKGVRDSELEILPYLKKVVLNADDLFLMDGVAGSFGGEIITFGVKRDDADLTAREMVFSDEGTGFLLCTREERLEINSPLSGLFNVYNSLAAASAAHALGFNLSEIKKGLESFSGIEMRFEIKKQKGVTFLNDVYNANPSSVEESIKELIRLSQSKNNRGRTIVVLGDMLELGDYGVICHRTLGQRLSASPVDIFIAVGPLMAIAVSEFRGRGILADTSEKAGKELADLIREGDMVLIKGSRGMKMERVLENCGTIILGRN